MHCVSTMWSYLTGGSYSMLYRITRNKLNIVMCTVQLLVHVFMLGLIRIKLSTGLIPAGCLLQNWLL